MTTALPTTGTRLTLDEWLALPYEHRGIASYWILDPLVPANELTVVRPFPLRLRPVDLLT